jgi:tetratricopeptide (TPR) repeat protein
MTFMELKDVISLAVSGLALTLSITATLISLKQKKFESERLLRSQLTDAIGKVNSSFEQSAKLLQEKAALLNDPAVTNLLAFYNSQKISYARQAVYVADQIPTLVSDVEYNSIARAFLDAGDDQSALTFYDKAVRASSGIHKATNLRGLGRTLLQLGKTEEGNRTFNEALSLMADGSDSSLWFQAETFQRWAQVEANWGNIATASKYMDEAEVLYEKIGFEAKRNSGLKNLAALRKTVFRAPTEEIGINTPPPNFI